MIKHFIASAIVALALGGCADMHPEEKLPPQTQAPGVELTKEQNGRFIAFVSPRQQHSPPFLGVDDTNFFCLRSWLDTKSGERAYQLYVEDSYAGAERNWDAAHDAQGQKLKFILISKNEITCENGCSYAEEFAAELPEALLRASADGLSVTFTAKSGGEKTIAVSGKLIADQLAAVDAARAELPSAAAAPPK